MRGRKPIPTALKKTRGTLRKSRTNTREPIPPGGDLRPPASFDEARLALWKYFIENAPEGLLRPLDGPTLAVLVDAVIEHRIAAAAFAGRNRVAQHRLVYDALAPFMARGLHALAIEVF